MKDPYSGLLVKQSLTPAARVNGTVNGTAVDRAEDDSFFQDALVVVSTGVITDGSHAISVEHSDDNSIWAAVPAADLQGVAPTIVAADDNKIFEVGYQGRKRYLRVVAVTSGATTGGIFGADIIQAGPRVAPVIRN